MQISLAFLPPDIVRGTVQGLLNRKMGVAIWRIGVPNGNAPDPLAFESLFWGAVFAMRFPNELRPLRRALFAASWEHLRCYSQSNWALSNIAGGEFAAKPRDRIDASRRR
jgi:hypothetical protein